MRTILPRYPNAKSITLAEVPASEKTPQDTPGHPWLSQISIVLGSTAALWFLWTSGFFDGKKK